MLHTIETYLALRRATGFAMSNAEYPMHWAPYATSSTEPNAGTISKQQDMRPIKRTTL